MDAKFLPHNNLCQIDWHVKKTIGFPIESLRYNSLCTFIGQKSGKPLHRRFPEVAAVGLFMSVFFTLCLRSGN